MERAAQQQLLLRIRELELENAALKEDMLIFERLIPSAGGGDILRVEGFRLFSESATRYRYRLLFAFQPAKPRSEFRGAYVVSVRYRHQGKDGVMQVPAGGRGSLEVRRFLRLEGAFDLPEGASLVSSEVLVYEGGQVTLRESGVVQ